MIQTPLRTRSPASASRCAASDAPAPSTSAERLAQPVDARRAGASISASVSWSASRMARTSSAPTSRREPLEQAAGLVGLGVEREPHPEPELGVVLEQRVVPGRAAAGRVDRPRRGRQVGAVDRRAAGGVGHDHPVAEELADEPDVGRLAAAAAGARELEERLEHLAALDRVVRRSGSRSSGGIDWKKSQRGRSMSRCSSDRLHVDRLVARCPSCSWPGRRRRTRRSRCSRPARPGSSGDGRAGRAT